MDGFGGYDLQERAPDLLFRRLILPPANPFVCDDWRTSRFRRDFHPVAPIFNPFTWHLNPSPLALQTNRSAQPQS